VHAPSPQRISRIHPDSGQAWVRLVLAVHRLDRQGREWSVVVVLPVVQPESGDPRAVSLAFRSHARLGSRRSTGKITDRFGHLLAMD